MSGPTVAQEKPEAEHWALAPLHMRERLLQALQARTGRVWTLGSDATLRCVDVSVDLLTMDDHARAVLTMPMPDGGKLVADHKHKHPFSDRDYAHLASCLLTRCVQVYQDTEKKYRNLVRYCASRTRNPFQPMELS